MDPITPEQDSLLSAHLDQWLRIGYSTEPLDRPAATEALCAIYQALGRPRPTVVFFSSPAMCIVAWGVISALWVDRKLRGQLQEIWQPLSDQLEDQLVEQLGARLEEGELGKHVRERLVEPLEERLARLRYPCENDIEGQLRIGFLEPWWHQLEDQLWEQLDDEQLGYRFKSDHLRRRVDGELLPSQLYNYCAGPWRCATHVGFDYMGRSGDVYEPRQQALLQLWLTQCRDCHWWFPYEGIVLASDRPRVLELDEGGRLHSAKGPALEYRDGHALHAWHGVRVPARVITRPRSLTVLDIEREGNAEIRRVMIERYGLTRYVADCGAEVVDSVPMDHPVVGLRGARLLVKKLDGDREPIVYLEMVNSTADADGTYKRYIERIDPKAYNGAAGRLCHAAMASRWRHRDDQGRLVRTFARWQDYMPTAES